MGESRQRARVVLKCALLHVAGLLEPQLALRWPASVGEILHQQVKHKIRCFVIGASSVEFISEAFLNCLSIVASRIP